jgi:acid phosphatase type 7
MSNLLSRAVACALTFTAACTGDIPTTPLPGTDDVPHPASSPIPTPTAAVGAVTLSGAGDIAKCPGQAAATARLLAAIPGTIFTAGDNVYPDGDAAMFSSCYGSTWGGLRSRTRPSPGNHDYLTAGAAAYFAYFGTAAGPRGRGYYSYDLGAWHIISLNSEVSANPGSAQERWLRLDLAAHPRRCTLAYWHKPLFSSGHLGGSRSVQGLWPALYAAGVEVVVNGHDHDYERFAPQTATGRADAKAGIREFVAGTGGAQLLEIRTPVANSQFRYNKSHGVLSFTLSEAAYDWKFIAVSGAVVDAGHSSCH